MASNGKTTIAIEVILTVPFITTVIVLNWLLYHHRKLNILIFFVKGREGLMEGITEGGPLDLCLVAQLLKRHFIKKILK